MWLQLWSCRLVFWVQYNTNAKAKWNVFIFYEIKSRYRISANSFRGNYSFLNLTLCTVTKVTVHTGAETIQGRKLFKGGNYWRKYGI